MLPGNCQCVTVIEAATVQALPHRQPLPKREALFPVPRAPYPSVATINPLPWHPDTDSALRRLLPSPVDPDPFVVPPGPVSGNPGKTWARLRRAGLHLWRRGRLPHDYFLGRLVARGRLRRGLLGFSNDHPLACRSWSTLRNKVVPGRRRHRWGIGQDSYKHRRC
jgi:hypothetical protein